VSELPDGWIEARLDQIADVTLGQSPPGSSYNGQGAGMPFFQGKAEFGDLRPAVKKWTTDPRKLASSDDVLLSVRAPVGPTNLAPCDCAVGRGLAAIHPLGNIDPRYVLWVLRATTNALTERGTGTTFQAVSGSQVRAHAVPVAPLAEQRRIVAAIEESFSRLDEADGSLQRAQRRVLNLKAALLSAAFGAWPERMLGDLAKVFVGTTPSRSAPELWEGDVPWVSSGEVAFCRIRQTRETISPAAVSLDRLHPPGTVLLAMIGEGKTRGQAAILDVAATHNQNSAAIRLDSQLCTPEWLFYVLMGRYEETRRAGTGAQQPALNRARVQALRIPLPPLEDQRLLVEDIERQLSLADTLAAGIDRARRRSAALRRSILSQAFSGRLTPQDPSYEPASLLLERIAAERVAARAEGGGHRSRRASMKT
jgi:type I restriction enzyme, S subunit